MTLRVTLKAPRRARPQLSGEHRGSDGDSAVRTTACWFDAGGSQATPRYARDALGAGSTVSGPAVIEDAWSTVVLPPGATLDVDSFGHLHIDVGEAP